MRAPASQGAGAALRAPIGREEMLSRRRVTSAVPAIMTTGPRHVLFPPRTGFPRHRAPASSGSARPGNRSSFRIRTWTRPADTTGAISRMTRPGSPLSIVIRPIEALTKAPDREDEEDKHQPPCELLAVRRQLVASHRRTLRRYISARAAS